MADVFQAFVLALILAKHGDGPPVYGVLFGGIFVAVIGFGIYLRWITHQDEKKKNQP
jgi:hypothetical protein